MNNLLFAISIMCLLILLLIVLLKKLNQPYRIACLFTGIFSEPENISALGDIRVEINIPDKKNLLFKPVIAQVVL